ncbi:DNA-binding transcriptional regulator, PadR family [Seinonella peptonophila]|uniref:DNA-binding transcriptional regulator, PadR family n=1 Tax=Seinonella peptonophila TaxID=112248 RepID=A0A1M5B8H5_9BACL|nr:PadR family transcriptional regulator [Seinonella peptonophila]SHF38748.1 DNA-binding transcriptional regulator, PadR family [Seinonella peptonophila]
MNTTQLLVLGAIALRKQTHGYVVYRELIEWRVDSWACIKPGSIYHALTQLEKKQYIKPIKKEPGEKGGARTLYAITDKGNVVLKKGIKKALESLEMDQYSAGIAMRRLIPHDVLLQTQRKRLENLNSIHQFMCTLPKKEGGSPAEEPSLVNYWTGFFEYNIQHVQAFIKNVENEVKHEG